MRTGSNTGSGGINASHASKRQNILDLQDFQTLFTGSEPHFTRLSTSAASVMRGIASVRFLTAAKRVAARSCAWLSAFRRLRDASVTTWEWLDPESDELATARGVLLGMFLGGMGWVFALAAVALLAGS